MNRALTLKWFAVLGLASLFYLLAPRDVSPQMPLYLGMTSAAVIIWTFDLLPAVAVAAALTFLYLLTNMAPPEVVLGPWTTVLIWTTFGAAIFGEAMEKTGLAKRVALRCMLLTGGTFTGMLIGFAIGGIILGLLLASGFARTVIFCAIAVGIIRALDIDPKSRLSSIIVIACFFAAAAPTMQFLHTSESFIWSFQVLMKAPCGNVNWFQCSEACTKDIWERGEVPEGRCSHCGAPLAANTIEAKNYIEEGYLPGWNRYKEWLSHTLNHRLLVLELGEGFKTPTVIRWPFEKTVYFNRKADMYRVNRKFAQVSEEIRGRAVPVAVDSLEFIRKCADK